VPPAAKKTPPVTSMAAEDDAETDTKNVLNSEKEQEIYREESDTRKAERRVKQEQVENNAAKNKISEDVTDSAVASSAESGTSYVIKPGDTLYQISISRYGTGTTKISVGEIFNAGMDNKYVDGIYVL